MPNCSPFPLLRVRGTLKDKGKDKDKELDMARRFYDSGLINQRWYMELAPKLKALYIHCLCACDCAGIFEVNPIMMSAQIGDKITEQDIFTSFGSRIIPLADYKALLVDFVYFQCGGELKHGCRPHDAIIKRLKEVGMDVSDLQKACTHELRFTPYADGPRIVKPAPVVKELPRVISEKKPDDSAEITEMFVSFWKAYPRHEAKQNAYKKFCAIIRDTKPEERKSFVEAMISAVVKQRQSDQWMKDNGQYIPMPTTWLNQRRWEDEGVVSDKKDDNGTESSNRISDAIFGRIKI